MDPSRRDVVGRIADYYVAKGDASLENEQLESALEAYAAAVEANPMHESAEANRLRAAKLIQERDGRMADNQALVERAEQLTALADQEALQGRSAEAIDLLREAEHVYMEVTDEFPLEAKLRDRGGEPTAAPGSGTEAADHGKRRGLQRTGYVQDVRQLVEQYGQGMDEAGFEGDSQAHL